MAWVSEDKETVLSGVGHTRAGLEAPKAQRTTIAGLQYTRCEGDNRSAIGQLQAIAHRPLVFALFGVFIATPYALFIYIRSSLYDHRFHWRGAACAPPISSRSRSLVACQPSRLEFCAKR
jgi:hypothetical protein